MSLKSLFTAALLAATTLVASPTAGQLPAPPTDVRLVVDSVRRNTLDKGPQWTIADDGHYVTAENAVLRLRFAYNAQNYQGWFIGTTSGGGGRDGAIVELYYKPTSPTRNLIFRNGTWGSGYDALDFWEAENQSTNKTDFDSPDFESGRHAVLNSRSVVERAGRLIATFDFQFKDWRIVRTYTVYPWGDITVHATVTQTRASEWSFFAHRFGFGVSRGQIKNGSQTYDWGGQYRADGEQYHAWTDGVPDGYAWGSGSYDGRPTEDFYHYQRTIGTVNENSFSADFDRDDQYTGFMLDDRNDNDPDILVFSGAPSVLASPYSTVTRDLWNGMPYIETAVFNVPWATPVDQSIGQMTFFYMTTAAGPNYTKTLWPTSLGSWQEVTHVLLRRKLGANDYLPIWKASARDLAHQAPTGVVGATTALNPTDNLYHLRANAGASTISFMWRRHSAAASAIDYRTAFVVDGFDPSWVRLDQQTALSVNTYYDPASHSTLLVLEGNQPATAEPVVITLGR